MTRFPLLLALAASLTTLPALASTVPGAGSTDSIRVIRADYIDTLQIPDRAKPQAVATLEADGQKIQIISYFPEMIVRQNERIIVFGLLDDAGQISKIFTKEPKATMQVARLGEKDRPCVIVRWEEAVKEGEGEAVYKFVQVWDVARRVCLANERWAAAAGPVGSTAAGTPPAGCAAEVSVSGGKLVIGEKNCPPAGGATPRTAVRVDAAGAYALVGGRLTRCK